MNTHSVRFSKLLRVAVMTGVLCLASYATIADAAQGCGQGLHRNGYGGCNYNHPGPNATPAPNHPGCWRNGNGRLRCYR
jgi:hypothetical protein